MLAVDTKAAKDVCSTYLLSLFLFRRSCTHTHRYTLTQRKREGDR
jgi:hypothetical protein